MSDRGKLIVFEGPDGVGKTTVSKALASALNASGVRTTWLSFPGRESGTLGKLVYDLHHRPFAVGVGELHPASLQLLHVAAHIDAIERVIRPAIERGECVILDRYWWSTWVYGIVAGAAQDGLARMIDVERAHWGSVVPDAVVLVRRNGRGVGADDPHRRLMEEYERLARRESSHHPVVRLPNDASVADAVERLSSRLALVPKSAAPRRKVPSTARPASAPVAGTAPAAWVKLAPLKPTPVYDTYWRFAAERQAIFFRRLGDGRPPWTDDPILREFKFTNAYRASDRVSQYLIRHVIYDGDAQPDEVFFRTLLFKLFNRIDTWELLRRELGSLSYANFRFDRYDRVLTKAIGRGKRIYSAAYIMPSGGARSAAEGGRKHRMHLRLLETMLREEVPARLAEAPSMRQAFDVLRSYPTIGDFLAYQFVTDLNYSTLTNFSEMQFVVPGPGARDGLRKCFTDLGGLNESEAIRVVADRQDAEFERLGLGFQDLWGRKLQLIDCQNLFCEVDKYARVHHPEFAGRSGRTRIKQRYRQSEAAMTFWFPPKWGINEAIAKEPGHVPQLLWTDR